MPRVLPWLVGMLMCGVPLEAAAEAGTSPLLVRLAWTDPVGTLAGGWFQAAEETARVLARLGLHAESRGAPVSEALSPEEIRVILVPGAPPRRNGGRSAIGAASSTGSVPRVWVRPDGIAAILGAATPFRPLSAPPEVVLRLDRLLGRVVAHEVVHLLAPTVPHGRGLMSGCVDVDEFLQANLRIDPEVAVLVHMAVDAGRTAVASREGDDGEVSFSAGP
jgi:hypothetical protein